MNLDFKRILGSVMALVMICSSLVIGNGVAVFADESGEMTITDVTVEESAPADDNSATDATDTQEVSIDIGADEESADNDTVFSSVVDDEPLFINLGVPESMTFDLTGGTVEADVVDLAADSTKTWTAGETVDWVGGLGTSGSSKTRAITFSDGTSFEQSSSNNILIAQNGSFTITAAEAASVDIYIAATKTGSIASVTGAASGTATINNGNISLRDSTSANIVKLSFDSADTYNITLTGANSDGFALYKIVYTAAGDTPADTYMVSVNESPAEGGTFTLTDGTVNCTDDSSSNTFPAGDVTLTVTPADGYEVESVMVGDQVLTGTDNTYTYTISSDCTITITYIAAAETTTEVITTTIETTTETTTVATTTEKDTEATTSASVESDFAEVFPNDKEGSSFNTLNVTGYGNDASSMSMTSITYDDTYTFNKTAVSGDASETFGCADTNPKKWGKESAITITPQYSGTAYVYLYITSTSPTQNSFDVMQDTTTVISGYTAPLSNASTGTALSFTVEAGKAYTITNSSGKECHLLAAGVKSSDTPPVDTATVNITSENGTVSLYDGGELTVGKEYTFTVTPNANYTVSTVTINGEEVTADTNGNYSFTAIAGKNTIVVEYKADTIPTTSTTYLFGDATASDGETVINATNYTGTYSNVSFSAITSSNFSGATAKLRGSNKTYIKLALNAGDVIKVTTKSGNDLALYSDLTFTTKEATFTNGAETQYTATESGTYYITSASSGSNAYIEKLVIGGEATEAATGTLNVTVSPEGIGSYSILLNSTEVVADSANTYTLTENTAYTVNVTDVTDYTYTIKYGSQDITSSKRFVYNTATTDLTITYTAIAKTTITVNVTGATAVPSISGTALTSTETAGSYTFTGIVGTAYVVTASEVSGYDVTITIDGVESSTGAFTLSDTTAITIEYTEKEKVSEYSWNFNEAPESISSGTNELGNNLVYEAGSSDSIVTNSNDTNTYNGVVAGQINKGIHPGGDSGGTKKRYFSYLLPVGGTFTAYYVGTTGQAFISTDKTNITASKALAVGNELTALGQLGIVSYTNTSTEQMTIYITSDNKPTFIGMKVSGEIDPFTVSGKVVGPDNEVVANATVTPNISGISAVTTNENGIFTFTDEFTQPVKFTVTATGYNTLTTDSVSEAKTSDTYTISLSKPITYTVSGLVVDSNGDPIEGATVTVGDKSVTTSSDGAFTISGITGAAILYVNHDDYNALTVTLTGDGTTDTGASTENQTITLSQTINVKFMVTGTDSSASVIVTNPSGKKVTVKSGSPLEFETSPGQAITFTSTSTSIYEWYPIIDDTRVDQTEGNEDIKYHSYSGGTFTYTVPTDAVPSHTYGVEFVSDSTARFEENTSTTSIGYGQYGFGFDKIAHNAGKNETFVLTKAAAASTYSKYDARANTSYKLRAPSLGEFGNYSDNTYNGIDPTGGSKEMVNANQYGLLDANGYIEFTLNLNDSENSTGDVTIDKSGTIVVTDVAAGTAITGTSVPNSKDKLTYKLEDGKTYRITASAAVPVKSIRIFNPNNIFANEKDTGITQQMSTTDTNFYSERMGSVSELADTVFGQELGLDASTMAGYDVYRLVARLYIPASEQDTPEVYLDTVSSVGFEPYDAATFNTLKTYAPDGVYNADKSVDSQYVSLATEADEFALNNRISFTVANTAVMALKQDETTKEWTNDTTDTEMKYPYSGANMLFGEIGSTSFEDIYVQTFIACKDSIVLVPYTVMDGNTIYNKTDVSKTIPAAQAAS